MLLFIFHGYRTPFQAKIFRCIRNGNFSVFSATLFFGDVKGMSVSVYFIIVVTFLLPKNIFNAVRVSQQIDGS